MSSPRSSSCHVPSGAASPPPGRALDEAETVPIPLSPPASSSPAAYSFEHHFASSPPAVQNQATSCSRTADMFGEHLPCAANGHEFGLSSHMEESLGHSMDEDPSVEDFSTLHHVEHSDAGDRYAQQLENDENGDDEEDHESDDVQDNYIDERGHGDDIEDFLNLHGPALPVKRQDELDDLLKNLLEVRRENAPEDDRVLRQRRQELEYEVEADRIMHEQSMKSMDDFEMSTSEGLGLGEATSSTPLVDTSTSWSSFQDSRLNIAEPDEEVNTHVRGSKIFISDPEVQEKPFAIDNSTALAQENPTANATLIKDTSLPHIRDNSAPNSPTSSSMARPATPLSTKHVQFVQPPAHAKKLDLVQTTHGSKNSTDQENAKPHSPSKSRRNASLPEELFELMKAVVEQAGPVRKRGVHEHGVNPKEENAQEQEKDADVDTYNVEGNGESDGLGECMVNPEGNTEESMTEEKTTKPPTIYALRIPGQWDSVSQLKVSTNASNTQISDYIRAQSTELDADEADIDASIAEFLADPESFIISDESDKDGSYLDSSTTVEHGRAEEHPVFVEVIGMLPMAFFWTVAGSVAKYADFVLEKMMEKVRIT